MNGVDSFDSNQKCGIGYKHSHSKVHVSQCLASIRKLGNRKPSKETNLIIHIILAGAIENKNKKKKKKKGFHTCPRGSQSSSV